MSSFAPKHGLDKELAEKEEKKRNPEIEEKARKMLEEMSGEKVDEDLLVSLKSGVVLCKALNAVIPGAVPKVNDSSLAFKQMENITNFIRGCRTNLDIPEFELFTTTDLYDGKSIVNVVNSMVAFSRAAKRAGYDGMSIGPIDNCEKMRKHWDIDTCNTEVSKLSMGSSTSMQKTAARERVGPTWKSRIAVDSTSGSVETEHPQDSTKTEKLSENEQRNHDSSNLEIATGNISSPSGAAEEMAIKGVHKGEATSCNTPRKLYGLDKELADKERSKRNPEDEKFIRQLLEEMTGQKVGENLFDSLRDGVILCEAVNAVVPNSVKKINHSKISFKHMENIGNFLKACREKLSMKEYEVFTTTDLYDRKSIVNVTSGLVAFSRAALAHGYKSTVPKKES